MKVLIAYDGSENAWAALDDLRRAGLPRIAEAIVLSAADVDLPAAVDFMPQGMAINERLSNLLKARVQAVHDVVMKQRDRALLAIYDALQLALQAGERIKSDFPDWTVRARACAGPPASAVVKKADSWGADLIVVGTQGRSALGRFILGSVSQKVVSEVCCSVRVARSKPHRTDSPLRIIVGLDGSAWAEKAADVVAGRAWPAGSEVLLVTATKPFAQYGVAPDEQQKRAACVQQSAKAILRGAGLDVSSAIRAGEPKSVLVREAKVWGADAIFVGSRGLDSPFKRFFLGSVSTAIVANAPCSVEVVR
jgi:nucleotide-binding universal stress UspA family protein